MITVNDTARVRTLVMNRPEALNALNGQLARELTQALQDAAEDDNVRVVILTGNGKAFSAGADLSILSAGASPEGADALREVIPAMFDTMIDFPKPLVLAVNGMGIGFGATVLGLADIVVMAESARIMVPFSTLSVVPEACSSYTFPLRMGHQKAFWFLLSGEWMDAADCVEAGLAMEVASDEQVLDAAMRYATRLANFPTHTLTESKGLMRMHHREQLKATNHAEIERLIALLEHPAAAEGIAAIKEKRAPNYDAL